MAEEERSPSAGEQAKAIKEDFSPAKLNAKLEEVIEERPKTAHLLDFRLVGTALLAAVVIALGLWVIVNAQVAALALVVVFLIGWLGGAQLSYDRRRETTDARSGDEEKDEEGDRTTAGSAKGAEEEDSPARQSESRAPSNDEEYQGDRGEAEADQEQTTSSNGSGPARQRSNERD